MPVTRDDLVDALAAYWGQKTLQLENSRIANAVGAGTAGSVRGGSSSTRHRQVLRRGGLPGLVHSHQQGSRPARLLPA